MNNVRNLLVFELLNYFIKNLCFVVGNERRERRGSVGSLDSGMSISFQSTSNTTGGSKTVENHVYSAQIVAQRHQQNLLQNAAGQVRYCNLIMIF